MQLYDLSEEREKVILVGVEEHQGIPMAESLSELDELAQTAGALTVGRVIQNRESRHPGTYIGKGKIDEVAALIAETGADSIICDDELTPAQMANLSDALGIKVLDRTLLILDIFAGRASTSEGKLQVELAQLRYRATRLTGKGTALSRLGGGIGTRGPGEKKLEVDRRLIRDRIAQLQRELDDVIRHREVARRSRSKNAMPVVAIVGYTNAGKSTLLNGLTGAGVPEEDRLFATLDPTTRQKTLASGQSILFTDTVGFIHKLPHHLISAFRSTLEEARYADIIVHVVDVSNPRLSQQMAVVYETLENLGIQGKTVITAFNKTDKLAGKLPPLRDDRADQTVYISARTGWHLDRLLDEIESVLREHRLFVEQIFPYERAGQIAMIRKHGQLLEESYREDGIYVRAYIPAALGDLIEKENLTGGH